MKLSAFLSFCLVLNVSPLHASPHPECIAPNLVQKCKEVKCKSFPFPNCKSLVNAYPAGDQCCDEQTLKEYQRSWNNYSPKYNSYSTSPRPFYGGSTDRYNKTSWNTYIPRNNSHSYTRGPFYDDSTRYNDHSPPSYGGMNSGSGQNSYTYGNNDANWYSTTAPNETRIKRHTYRAGYGSTSSKWESPVLIYVDIKDDSKNTYMDNIKKAIEKISSVTCLTFEIVNQKPTTSHITFLKHTEGCASFVGKRSKLSSPIVGDEACLSKPGNILALLAQTLGLWHQTQRWDRDYYVSFLLSHMNEQDKGNFGKIRWSYIHDFGLIYDFASITHYAAKAFSKDDKYSVVPFNNDFFSTMGQKVELSFLDAMSLNLMHCSGLCNGTSTSCDNGGYVDPKDCSKCICLPGYQGEFCTQGVSTKMGCGGELQATETTASITSPNFESGSYPANVECEWLIKTSDGKIELSFSPEFDIYADEMGVCQNWVEVRYRNNITLPGPRFCGNEAPTEKIISYGSDVVVIFKSNTFENSFGSHKGFKLDFKAIEIDPCLSNPCLNGAQCLRINETYQCRCANGYAGDKCQSALSSVADPCSLQPCLNGGECEGSAGTFKCKCKNGFTGKYCEKANCGGCGFESFGYDSKCKVYFDPPKECNQTYKYWSCTYFGGCRYKDYVVKFPCIKEQLCCDYASEVNGGCARLGWTKWSSCSYGCGFQKKSRSFYGIVKGEYVALKSESELCPYKDCTHTSCSWYLSRLGFC